MSAMSVLWIVWAALAAGTVALMLYRATLSLHDDEQLFLGEVEHVNYERSQQQKLEHRENQVTPFVRAFSGATGLATIALVGIYTTEAIKVLAR